MATYICNYVQKEIYQNVKASICWVALASGWSFPFLFSKFYLMDDSARALAGNRWHMETGHFEDILLKGHFTKIWAVVSNRNKWGCSSQVSWEWVSLHPTSEGAKARRCDMTGERAVWTGHLTGHVAQGHHQGESWAGKPWPHSLPVSGSVAGASHWPNSTGGQSSRDPDEGFM